MPAVVGLRGRIVPESGMNYASLKAHKVLPRRKVMDDEFWKETNRESKGVNGSLFAGNIQAWIPDPSHPQVDPSLRLPLTPPSIPREADMQASLENPKSGALHVPQADTSRLSTSVDQRSPPTPEKTPPRNNIKTRGLTPPHMLRQSSSRGESFMTAREDFESDKEEVAPSPQLPSLVIPKQPTKAKTSYLTPPKAVGLGLGLELSDEDKTPTIRTPKAVPESWEFGEFDGSWTQSNDVVQDDPIVASKPIPMPHIPITEIAASPDKVALMVSPTLPTLDVFENRIGRGASLRERVEKQKQSPTSTSVEQFAEQIQWPLDMDKMDIDSRFRQAENRRFSQMSGTSTVIEVKVVDTTPQRRQTLRHMSKNVSLRTAGSQNHSNRSSVVSGSTVTGEPKHRLVHRNTRITDRGNRASLASDNTPSVESDTPSPQTSSVPVAVIPQRRSSLRSSAIKNKRLSRTITNPGTQDQAARPSTAPDGSTGHFDAPPRKIRTASGPNPLDLLTPSKTLVSKQVKPLPSIPVRGSSLSAPTSRNVSRTTSLTSSTIRAQTTPQAQPEQQILFDQQAEDKDQTPQASQEEYSTIHETVIYAPKRPRSPSDTGPSKGGDEDWSGVRHRSALVTPFSMTSMNSSTPGTLEVSEATAINIYPHNNKSVLVVQQTARGAPEDHDMSAFLEDNASFVITGPKRMSGMSVPDRTVDSPLRNPRAPPRPPAFAVIPATPADESPVPEQERRLESSGSKTSNSGRFSMVRRALSARRYSEPFIAPLTRSFSKRNSITNRPNTRTSQDRNLSPFWRPRGFWDDFSDSESDFGDDGFMVNNTLGLHQKRVIPGPSALARRFGSLKLRRRSPREGPLGLRRTSSNDSIHSYKFIQTEQNTGLMPRLGYQVQFVGLKGLQDKFEKRKLKKEEDRREKERMKLRQSIGPVVLRSDDYLY
jgi:hypothetical protein